MRIAFAAMDSPPGTPGPPAQGHRLLGLAVALTLAATLALSFAGKFVCDDGPRGIWGDNNWCYSDVRNLWDKRGFDVDAVPYAGPPTVGPETTDGQPPEPYPVDYVFEYPPGLGFPAWLIALATTTRTSYFIVSAITLALAAAVTVWQLDVALRALRRPRLRLFGLAASPSLVALGMQNWDLWALAPVAAGMAAAVRRKPLLAAVFFGIGAGIKWWPALLMLPLVVGPWSIPARLRRNGAVAAPAPGTDHRTLPLRLRLRPVLVFAAVWWAIQVPAIAVSRSGWWAAIAFHLDREPNVASPVGVIRRAGLLLLPSSFWETPYITLTTVVTFVALGLGLVVIARRLDAGLLGPTEACVALVALFLLTSKVVSVQFLLWLLPIALLSTLRWRWLLAADVLNVAVWLLWAPSGDDPNGLLYASLVAAALRTVVMIHVYRTAVQVRHPVESSPHVADRPLQPATAPT